MSDLDSVAVTPVAPEQTGGWKVLAVFHDVNLLWTVTARRGGQVLRTPRLTNAEVRAYDANYYWGKEL